MAVATAGANSYFFYLQLALDPVFDSVLPYMFLSNRPKKSHNIFDI